MAIVSVLRTEKYDPAVLRSMVDRHFEALDIENDLRTGMRVTIKPNLLAARHPEQVATTHPAVIGAVVSWLRDRGIEKITIADSPGGVYSRGNLKSVYDSGGYLALKDMAELNFDTGYQSVLCPEGFTNKSFNIINPIRNADYIINIAKLKTHGLTTVTGGVKNLFGVIPGLQKPEWHFKYPNIDDFSRMLIELALMVKPQVTLIDAVETMEGNGPLNGRPRHMGLTLCSRDIFAQDYQAAKLMGISSADAPILRQALKMGLLQPEDIHVTGDDATPAEPPYTFPESIHKNKNHNFLLRSIGALISRVYCAVPKIDVEKCGGCGKCAESCPMKLITITDKKAGMSTKKCISCFCCQEMCPFDAIRIAHRWRLPKI
ncbi:MAG: DUF362 domain-containing protein [Clostridiales bacterium]|nr:DUF362 domain-containing protein [Clostridiales bacterium]